MPKYTCFLIPGRDYPQNLVIKRFRPDVLEKMKAKSYAHFWDFDAKCRRHALTLASQRYLEAKRDVNL